MTAANVVTSYTSVQGDGGNVGKGVTTDSNPATNDYLVVCICGSSNADAMTKPDATWTEFSVSDNVIATGGGSIRAWWKKNPAASTTYTWTCSSGRTSAIGALVRGADGTTFANAVASLESAPGTNHAPPAVTSTTTDGLIMDFAGHRQFNPDVADWTVPTGLGFTEVQDIQGADGNNNIRLALGTMVQSGTGAVPTTVWTNSDVFEEAIIIRIVVTPAVPGGGSLTMTPGTMYGGEYRFTGGILVPGLVSVLPGISRSTEQFGTFVASPGTALLVPGTVRSEERSGTSTAAPGTATVTPGTVRSEERSGASTVTPGSATTAPGTSVQTEVFTGGILAGTLNCSPGTSDSGERFGVHSVTVGSTSVIPGSVFTQEQFGVSTVTPGASTVVPGRVYSAEAFGSVAFVPAAATVTPGVIVSQERFGAPVATPGTVNLLLGTAGYSEIFKGGSAFFAITQVLAPGTIASQERFGYAALITGGSVVERIPTYKVRLDRQYFEVDLTRPVYRVRLDRQVIEAELEG